MAAEKLFEGCRVTRVQVNQSESERTELIGSNQSLLDQALRSIITLHPDKKLEVADQSPEALALMVANKNLLLALSEGDQIEATGLSYLNQLIKEVARNKNQQDAEWYISFKQELDRALLKLVGKRFPW